MNSNSGGFWLTFSFGFKLFVGVLVLLLIAFAWGYSKGYDSGKRAGYISVLQMQIEVKLNQQAG